MERFASVSEGYIVEMLDPLISLAFIILFCIGSITKVKNLNYIKSNAHGQIQIAMDFNTK